MAVGDIYEVRLEGETVETTRWNMVCHYRKTVEGTANLFDSARYLAESIGASFGGGDLLTLMHDSSSLLSTRANRVWPTIGVSADSNTGSGSGGQSASDPMPSDVAVVCSKRTDEPGPRFRGRNFWTGMSEVQQDAGLFSAVLAGQLQTAFENLLTFPGPDSGGNEWEGVVFSRTQVAAAAAPVYAVITRVLLDRRCRTIRGRSDGLSIYV